MNDSQTRLPENSKSRWSLGTAEVVVIMLMMAVVIALILPKGSADYTPSAYMDSKNHLKQLGLGFHNYYDTEQSLPDESGGQSWATELLPYLDEGTLYASIDHSKPWNDPANEAPARQAVNVLLNPNFEETHDAIGFALSHYAANSNWIVAGSPVDFLGAPDGVSNTILAGEIAEGFMPLGRAGQSA